MTRFYAVETPLVDLTIINRKPIEDSRGYFERLFCIEDLQPMLRGREILQINHAYTEKKGTLRGMHFQVTPNSELKIVTCIRGEIYDVAVDLRPNSLTYMKWYGLRLKENDFQSLLIPEGFAHGYQSLTDNVDVIYFSTAKYNSFSERIFNPLDQDIKISWPNKITLISDKDSSAFSFRELSS
jgi:dTDP-4-dehydrorhamnose 3,5-epimerase